MNERSSEKRKLNINIGPEENEILESLCKRLQKSKTQFVQEAIRFYGMVREEELTMKEENPGKRIKTKVRFETFPRDQDSTDLAAVLVY